MDFTFDSMYYNKGEFLAGIDESGVSDIAGPLIAACVILPKIDVQVHDLRILEINDSKQIPEKYRLQHAEVVWKVATAIGIGEVTPVEIDYLGKYAAIRIAQLRAIAACKKPGTKKVITPNFLLIDGELTLPTDIPFETVIRGDAKSLAIAAASIVAKVYRDSLMLKLHEQFRQYGWDSNKGFPCEAQFEGLDKIGAQLGIHRTKYWPFVENTRLNQEEKEFWRNRRNNWRSMTEGRLFMELGGTEWTSKSKLSRHLMSLKSLQERVQLLSSEKKSKTIPTNSPSGEDIRH